MKKTLLFAILAFSINAFAQINLLATHLQQPTLNPMENMQRRMQDARMETPGIYYDKNPAQAMKQQSIEQNSLTRIVDSTYDWRWDIASNGWKINNKEIVLYDVNSNPTNYTSYTWNGSAWVKSSKRIYTYDANKNVTVWIGQNWNGSAWVNSYKYTYNYDANNNQTKELSQSLIDNTWVNSFQITRTFDANNNQISDLVQLWYSSWVSSSNHTVTYDANNNKTSELYQHFDSFGNAMNYEQDSYTYDVSNNLSSGTIKLWDNTTWVNYTQNNYKYNANNKMTSNLTKSWYGDAWMQSAKDTLTYDVNNTLTSYLSKIWNNNVWENYWLTVYSQNTVNNQSTELNQSWNGSTWVNSSQYNGINDSINLMMISISKNWNNAGTELTSGDSLYSYFHTVITGIQNLDKSGISVYPNPTNGKFTISNSGTASTIEIYNLSGARVYSDLKFKKQTSNEIDLSGYAKGIYLVKIIDGTKIQSRKIIVQ